MDIERRFFGDMKKLLKEELGVKSLVVGTADHSDGISGYPHLSSNLLLDYIDGHGYWEHPKTDGGTWIKNTPMVNDPLDSTVTQFARTPVVGRPFTISETNHPFPHKYACEGFPILTAYALLHDWDGIYWFTWSRGRLLEAKAGIRGHFDFSNDPVKMTNLAVCATMWHRQDVAAAKRLVVRSYGPVEMLESLRLKREERPFFTPGFARSTPLLCKTRFTLDGCAEERLSARRAAGADRGRRRATRLVSRGSQTGARRHRQPQDAGADRLCQRGRQGHEEPRGQGGQHVLRAGAHGARRPADRRSRAGSCWPLPGRPPTRASSGRKTSRPSRNWAAAPCLIEPVRGTLTLTGLAAAKRVTAQPLSPVGKPLAAPAPLRPAGQDWQLVVGAPATTWWLLQVER